MLTLQLLDLVTPISERGQREAEKLGYVYARKLWDHHSTTGIDCNQKTLRYNLVGTIDM